MNTDIENLTDEILEVIAKKVSSYRTALMKQGLPTDMVIGLTSSFQQSIVMSTMMQLREDWEK